VDVVSESGVLLCPYRFNRCNSITRRTQNSTLLLLSIPDNSASQSYLSSCDAQCLSSLFLNDLPKDRRDCDDRER